MSPISHVAHIRHPWFVTVCLILVGTAAAHAAAARLSTAPCQPASYGRASNGAQASFEDETGNYAEFRGVKYGLTTADEAFVGVGDQVVKLHDLPFKDLHGRTLRLSSDELAFGMAVAYRATSEPGVVCVLSPFSGLGLSGSFQRVAVLVAVRKPRGHVPLRVAGAITWVK
jgi:hypothetical protein